MNNFHVISKFGESFIVREGKENILPVWTEITSCEENCPDFLITCVGTDGEDGLCWTSWEECLVDWAIIQWRMSPNLLAEEIIGTSRQEQEKVELMDIISHYVTKMGPEISAKLFQQLCWNTGKNIFKPEMKSVKQRCQVGAARLLMKLEERVDISPLEVCADALEDNNHHKLSYAVRILYNGPKSILRRTLDAICPVTESDEDE